MRRAPRGKIVKSDAVAEVSGMVECVLAERDAKLDLIADRVRSEIVIPICDRYGLEWISGQGDYFFTDPKVSFHTHPRGRIASAEEAKDARLPEIAKAFQILDIDIDRSMQLGHYISDVRQVSS